MQETLRSKRFNLVNLENFEVDLEYNEQYAILHLPRVSKFNKSVYLEMVSKLEEIAEFVKNSGYFGLWLAIRPEDVTLSKLVKKLGFKHLGNAENLAVYQLENF